MDIVGCLKPGSRVQVKAIGFNWPMKLDGGVRVKRIVRPFRLLFSRVRAGVYRHYQKVYRKKVNKSESLRTAELQQNGTIVEALVRSTMSSFRVIVPFLLVAGPIVIIAPLTPAPLKNIMLGALYLAEIVLIAVIFPRLREFAVLQLLLELVILLETHPRRWPDPNFRGRINRDLEKVARKIEKLPQQLRPRDPATRSWLLVRADGAATNVRELKRWVSTPNPFTFTDLVERLIGYLSTIADGRWFDLPQSAVERQPRRNTWRQVRLLVLAVLAIATATLVLIKGVPNASIIGSVLGTVAVGALSASGFSVATIAQAADIADKFETKGEP